MHVAVQTPWLGADAAKAEAHACGVTRRPWLGAEAVEAEVHGVELALEGRLGLRPLELERRRQQAIVHGERLGHQVHGMHLHRSAVLKPVSGPCCERGIERAFRDCEGPTAAQL